MTYQKNNNQKYIPSYLLHLFISSVHWYLQSSNPHYRCES